jgi:hypothetical protein
VIIAKTGLGLRISKVKYWLFLRRLAKAEKRQLSIDTIVNPAGKKWNIGMMAQLGHLNNNKLTHKDWTK